MKQIQPWGWSPGKQQMRGPLANTIQPITASAEQAPPPQMIQATPSMEQQMLSGAATNAGMEGIDQGIEGVVNGNISADQVAEMLGPEGSQARMLAEQSASLPGSQAAMLAEQSAGFGSAGGEAIAGATGASNSFGPLAAAAGGIAEGNYGKAAGSAAGSVAGTAIAGPIGGYVGSMLGGWLGGGLGFEKGTPNVGDGMVKQAQEQLKSLPNRRAMQIAAAEAGMPYDQYVRMLEQQAKQFTNNASGSTRPSASKGYEQGTVGARVTPGRYSATNAFMKMPAYNNFASLISSGLGDFLQTGNMPQQPRSMASEHPMFKGNPNAAGKEVQYGPDKNPYFEASPDSVNKMFAARGGK
jgi:hypothetical protein